MLFFSKTAILALSVASPVLAQIFSSCNPTNATCTPDTGLNQWSYTADFTDEDAATQYSSMWASAVGYQPKFSSQGMVFNISNAAQAPTITSNFTFLFGRLDVKMQAAPGTGIISYIVMESKDLDEVDFEVLGGNTTTIDTDYFGKGADNVGQHVAVSNPQTQVHTYSIEWTSSSLVWQIDGTTVRTLAYSDANGGDSFPQSPMAVKLGSWDGGKPGGQPGTIAWAGGVTDFSQGPFVMYIESITVTNYNPANYYNWTDKTGSFSSINAINTTAGSTNTTGNDDSSNAASTTVASIIGGPTLVSATAKASGAAATGATSSKNWAGKTVGDASMTGFVGAVIAFILSVVSI